MSKNKPNSRRGLTLVELMVAIMLLVIFISAVAVILIDSQLGWSTMYSRIYSGVATDGYIARKTFDATIRKASREKYLLDEAGNWIEVYYYADDESVVVDRYARFYYEQDNSQLNIEYGSLEPKETLSTQVICGNVSGCTFKGNGRSIQMILVLDNGSQTATITSSAVMHNK